MAVDFKSISNLGSMQSTDAFQSYTSSSATGTQFYNTTWMAGTVIATTNQVTSNYLLLYDKVRQEVFIRPKGTSLIVQADKSQVSSFTLSMDKPHVFVPAAAYDVRWTIIFLKNWCLLPTTTLRCSD